VNSKAFISQHMIINHSSETSKHTKRFHVGLSQN